MQPKNIVYSKARSFDMDVFILLVHCIDLLKWMFSGCEPPRTDKPGAGSEAKQGERASLDALLRRELRHSEGGGGDGRARPCEVSE